MINETILIKSTKERTLTAKGYKFLIKCIDIASKQRGLTRYHLEIKETKDKLRNVVTSLIIDKGLSIEDIKDLIKNRESIIIN